MSRLFKESFGINFVDYLNQYRIEKAKELLNNYQQTGKKDCFHFRF
jgi:YesN/AraC family two-component response regulator